MSLHKILENWSDYDDKKKKYTDANFFACTESWEREHLVRKIRNHHPEKTVTEVERAIHACCQELRSPHPRKEFIQCVLKWLGLL